MLVLPIVLCFLHTITHFTRPVHAEHNEDCPFFDTVNVTGAPVVHGDFHVVGGVMIPPDYVSVYDYVYDRLDGARIEVKSHQRACICRLGFCIAMCCPWGSKWNVTSVQCEKTSDRYNWSAPLLSVISGEGVAEIVNIFEHFVVQYCLVPTLEDGNSTEFVLKPALCDIATERTTVQRLNAYAMITSIPFLLLTIIVYLWVPKLRCLLGKCLICYLLCLVVGYAMLALIIFRAFESCFKLAYTGHYFFLAAFFWLSAMSYHLWRTLCGSKLNGSSEARRFSCYSLYAWGVAAVFTSITYLADKHLPLPSHLRPGLSDDFNCWIDVNSWSSLIYFYGPIMIVIICNGVLFILTARNVHRTHSDTENFGLFLRLFILMGLTWSLEILSYVFGSRNLWTKVFYISDFLNALQGFLIFVLFVLRKTVWRLLKQSCDRGHINKINSISEPTLVKYDPNGGSIILENQHSDAYNKLG